MQVLEITFPGHSSRAHHPSIRTLILQSFLVELSNRTESLTVDVRYLAFSIADNASRFWSAAFV